MTDRFTADLHIRVPQGMRVFASGSSGASKPVTLTGGKPGDEYDFKWAKPGFPGTVIAGRFLPPVSAGAGNVKVYVTITHQASVNALAQTATSEYNFFTDTFGCLPRPASTSSSCPTTPCPPSTRRAGRHHGLPHRRQIRHSPPRQHHRPPVVGLEISPKPSTTPGSPTACRATASSCMSRIQNGQSALKAAMEDVAAGALAYDTIPSPALAVSIPSRLSSSP